MPRPSIPWTRLGAAGLLLAGLLGSLVAVAAAGEVRLKNGMVFAGNPKPLETLYTGPRRQNSGPITIYPILMVSSPLRKYYFPARRVDEINRNVDLSKNERFTLTQQKLPGAGKVIQSVGDFVEKPAAFDSFGRRTVKLRTSAGDVPVIQGVVEIAPEYARVNALNFTWETALATSSIPHDVLDAMLRQNIEAQSPEHRLKIARFYIQSEKYAAARFELDSIKSDFPELAETVDQVNAELTQFQAEELLRELKLRRLAGQHQLVSELCRRFPVEGAAAPVLREVREIVSDYEQAAERADQARALLSDLQGQLSGDPRSVAAAPLRAEISERLSYSTLDRLEPLFKLADDSNLSAAERLALALSGWVVGGANASTELDQAIRLWQARFLVQEFLRTTPDAQADRVALIEKLSILEGISATQIAQLLALLPPPRDGAGAEPGRATRVQVSPPKADVQVAYHVLLPREYQPEQRYPAIVALHALGRAAESELVFWGGTEEKPGQSQRHGYIVIAPEYQTRTDLRHYDYSAGSHRVVLESLRDARSRFNIDSDRVFLSGHIAGGDAAFDMAMSHPDLFAGVIPITGVSDRYCQYYWENARNLPLYVISGELDRDSVSRNARELMRMMQQNFDLTYVEYVGGGLDSYYSEIHRLFDWMSRYRRGRLPRQVEARVLRPTDGRFYWFEIDGIPDSVSSVDWTSERRRAVKPLNVQATYYPGGNAIAVTARAARTRLWLAPGDDFVDFERRLSVRINGTQRWHDFVKPDLNALLDHVRLHGDRQQLYWAVLEF